MEWIGILQTYRINPKWRAGNFGNGKSSLLQAPGFWRGRFADRARGKNFTDLFEQQLWRRFGHPVIHIRNLRTDEANLQYRSLGSQLAEFGGDAALFFSVDGVSNQDQVEIARLVRFNNLQQVTRGTNVVPCSLQDHRTQCQKGRLGCKRKNPLCHRFNLTELKGLWINTVAL